jgi:hypothetical protein
MQAHHGAAAAVGQYSVAPTVVEPCNPIDSLSSYWGLNGNDNDSISANNGTASGTISYTTGVKGNANGARSTVGGTDGLITMTSGGVAASRSYSLWVNISGTSLKGAFLGDANCYSAADNQGFAIGVGSGDTETVGNRLIVPFWGVAWQDTGINIGTGWHHIVVVIGSDRKATVYLDGGASTYTGTAVMNVTSNNKMLLFGRWTAYGVVVSKFAGKIDSVRFYSRTLTASDVTAIYNGEKP